MNETFGQESGAGERSLRSLRRALKRKRSSIPLFLRANTQRAYEGAVDRFSAWGLEAVPVSRALWSVRNRPWGNDHLL